MVNHLQLKQSDLIKQLCYQIVECVIGFNVVGTDQ